MEDETPSFELSPTIESRLADNHARVAQIIAIRAALDEEWAALQAEQSQLMAQHRQESPQEGLTLS